MPKETSLCPTPDARGLSPASPFNLHTSKAVARFLVLLLSFLMCQTLSAAVGFVVAPTTVSNTHRGAITLQITGLSAGETIVVQRFLDLNTNSVIDAADMLWQQFRLTDGQASVVGCVTNINVPGDTDSVPGRIAARLNFPTGEPGLSIIGRYAWRLSSPTGRFAPITNTFTISNADYPQGLTGQVHNNGTNVPNALVLVFHPPGPGDDSPGWVVAGTVADNSGGYAIRLPSGTYAMTAFKSDFVGDFVPTPVVVSNGVMVSTDVTVSNTTRFISGKLVDATNSAVGLPGLLLHVTGGGLAAAGSSDADGNFTLRVAPGLWRFGASGVESLGYLDRDSDTLAIDTTTGSVSGLVIAYPKATALFYGSVRDQQNQPLAGVYVFSGDDRDFHDHTAFTDENGNYVAGALGGTDEWSLEIDDDQPTLTNYLYSPGLYQPELGVGQAVLHDFKAILPMNHITGYLRDHLGNPIPDVAISAYGEVAGEFYYTGTRTDTNGYYSLLVANGTWDVQVRSGGNPNSLSSSFLPPPDQVVGVTNSNATANFTALLAPYHIVGSVRDSGNNPILEAYVYAYATVGGTNYFIWDLTDGSGSYSLGVVSGTWSVNVNCDGLRELGYDCVDMQTVGIMNANGTADFIVEPCGLEITTVSPLPPGTVDDSYSFQFEAASCDENLSWHATNAPFGLHLSANGVLSGNPATCGSNNFVVVVRDHYGASASKAFSLVIDPSSTGSITEYYVGKMRGHRQTNAMGPVLDSTHGPYNAILGILQDFPGAVSLASCTLPTSLERSFPPGCSALELQVHEAFTGEAACDAAFPSGNYAFTISTSGDGDQFPVLNFPLVAYPNAPRLRNYAGAQAIHPASDFMLEWDAFSDGAEDDFIRLIITQPGYEAGFKRQYPEPLHEEWLGVDATSASLPVGLLEVNNTYVGILQFVRIAGFDDTGHPNAVGVTFVGAQTVFSLSTTPATPVLSEPERLSPSEFQFLVTGLAGQTYIILKSSDLASTDWSVLLVTNAPASSFTVVDPLATNSSSFYRAVSCP